MVGCLGFPQVGVSFSSFLVNCFAITYKLQHLPLELAVAKYVVVQLCFLPPLGMK